MTQLRELSEKIIGLTEALAHLHRQMEDCQTFLSQTMELRAQVGQAYAFLAAAITKAPAVSEEPPASVQP